MNSKKKNKIKQNTPQNTTPQTDTTQNTNIVKTDIEEKSEELVKSEECVPGIISESVKEVEGVENAPKKPKRNRGKKNIKNKEDDNVAKESSEVADETQFTSEVQDKGIPETLKEVMDEPNVAPNARKKKNKNKKTDQSNEMNLSEQELTIGPIKDEDKDKDGNFIGDVKIVTCVPVLLDEEKHVKKKNKKKRSNSERSDKAEDISCISAFQKLLEPRDDKNDGKPISIKDTSSKDIEKVKSDKQDDKEIQESLDVQEGNKNKKKNKKNKKHLPTTDVHEEKPTDVPVEFLSKEPSHPTNAEIQPNFQAISTPVEVLLPQGEAVSLPDTNLMIPFDFKNIASETQAIIKSEEKNVIEKDKSLKSEAKIANPVQKKDKTTDDLRNLSQSISSIEETIENQLKHTKESQNPISSGIDGKHHSTTSIVVVQKLPETSIVEKSKSEELMNIKPEECSLTTPQNEKLRDDIQIPETGALKKRKQSSKSDEKCSLEASTPTNETKRPTEKNIECAILETNNKLSKTNEESSILVMSVAPKQSDNIIYEKKLSENTKQMETFTKKETPEPACTSILLGSSELDSELLEDQANLKTTKQEISKSKQIPIPESEITKKRKRSPKLPIRLEPCPEIEPLSLTKESELLNKKAQSRNDKDDDDLLDFMPLLEDIDNIKCIKPSDSEGLSTEIFPDIQFPRSTSQLAVDSNNNLVIQEIGREEVKLNISVDIPETPFIQSSRTLTTPELAQTGIIVSDVCTGTKVGGEKTDLKSKVLEVNQDMEDLRMSIERSLAELTAMEKSEKTTEKSFKTAQAKLEEIKELATKQKDTINKEQQEKSKEKSCEKRQEKEQEPAKIEPQKSKNISQVKSSEILSKTVCVDELSDVLSVKTDVTKIDSTQNEVKAETPKPLIASDHTILQEPPVIPVRKDNKCKGKKKKGRQEIENSSTTSSSERAASSTATSESKDSSQDSKTEQKSEKTTDTQDKGKQQTASKERSSQQDSEITDEVVKFQPIENFEDALTSSTSQDDVNKSFELIANETINTNTQNNPDINITAPVEDDDKKDEDIKLNPVSQPKNLLGHPAIPARLSKTDYKKEKNKIPNARQARVKIKDSNPIEINKESKESQTENKKPSKDSQEMTPVTNESEHYIYKYNFRKVFLPSACHVCKKDLKQSRVPCGFCNLLLYCSPKHKDENNSQHQALCFAVSTISHLKGLKHMYGDAQNVTGHEYRLLRMQAIISCEKVLKRRLLPYEQEMLLYPRMCIEPGCREWKQGKLKDCEGCSQVSYCTPEHLPPQHQRWCKSYSLYQRLVMYQQTKGRLEPKLPTKVFAEVIPNKMNEVLASLYEEKINMNDIQYAALTQIATAPLTAAYCYQLYNNKINSTYANGVDKKSTFSIHVVGAELQFEADALNKWEVFFLHLRPEATLRVVLIGPDLNPGKLPVELLGKIRLCDNCRENNRRVIFDFQDGKTYHEYWSSDFTTPDLVCAFNPSIHRTSASNGKDSWQSTINCILKQKVPFLITSYTLNELNKDLERIKSFSDVEFTVISEAKLNTFASVRPDRNFISDDEMPLLFKNYCYLVVAGNA